MFFRDMFFRGMFFTGHVFSLVLLSAKHNNKLRLKARDALCQSVLYFSKQPSTLKQLIFSRQRLTRRGTGSSRLAARSQMMLVRLRRERYSPSDLLRQPRAARETL